MRSFFHACAAIVIALGLALPLTPAKAASDTETVTAFVKDFFNNMASGSLESLDRMHAAFADQSTITDEFPPYTWQGADTLGRWGKDFMADSAKHKVTEPVMKFGEVTTVRVSGDHAYVVAPATYDYKADGKAAATTKGLFTFALTRTAGSWKISAMTWTIN